MLRSEALTWPHPAYRCNQRAVRHCGSTASPGGHGRHFRWIICIPKSSCCFCTAHLSADGKNAQAEIKGASLGGTLSARIHTGIFSKTRETSFSASLLKQKLEQLESLLPSKNKAHMSAGMADVHLSGTHTQQSGIEGKIAVAGQGVSVKDSSGKTLASGIAATIGATIRGKTLTVTKGLLSHAGGPSLQVGGTVERFASADRTGYLTFSMPSTAINSLLDAFANALPRNLQEASCAGSCSLAGSVELRGASSRINGNLSLESASLEIPSQKLTVAGIAGSLPFSLEIPWQGAEPKHAPLSYSRENYSSLLKDLNRILVRETAFRSTRSVLEHLKPEHSHYFSVRPEES